MPSNHTYTSSSPLQQALCELDNLTANCPYCNPNLACHKHAESYLEAMIKFEGEWD